MSLAEVMPRLMPGFINGHRDIGRWPPALRIAVAAALALATVASGHGWLIAPARHDLRDVQQQQRALQGRIEIWRQRIAALPRLQAETNHLLRAAIALAPRLPEPADAARLDDIGRAAAAAGLRSPLMQRPTAAQRPVDPPQPIELSGRLVVSGGFHGFGAFAEALAALPRLVRLDELEIVAGADGHAPLRLTATLLGYARSAALPAAPGPAPEPVSEPVTADATDPATTAAPPTDTARYTATGYRDPFTAAAVAAGQAPATPGAADPAGHPLLSWPLEALHLLGTLTVRGEQLGLLRSPDGQLYRVAAGDRIGTRLGRVIEVRRGRIDVIERIPDDGGWAWRPAQLVVAP